MRKTANLFQQNTDPICMRDRERGKNGREKTGRVRKNGGQRGGVSSGEEVGGEEEKRRDVGNIRVGEGWRYRWAGKGRVLVVVEEEKHK